MALRLYELADAYAAVAARAESGEDVSDALSELSDAIEHRSAQLVCVLRDLEGDCEKLTHELARLDARKRALSANVDRIKRYLRETMVASGVERIKGASFSITLSEGPPRVEVDDPSKVPAAYKRVREEIDKARILDAYKSDGEFVEGTRIERGTRLTIR